MELRSVDAGANRYRRYCLAVQYAIDGGGQLIVSWGRIGRRLRARVERFASAAELERRYQELLGRRRRHAYEVFSSESVAKPAVAERPASESSIDTATRFVPMQQSNGYVGIYDSTLQGYLVRDSAFEIVAPLAHTLNLNPGRALTLVNQSR
jgi:predicted DNA-binding WGR domain protein